MKNKALLFCIILILITAVSLNAQTYYRFRNVWNGSYLYQSSDQLVYGSPGADDTSSHWEILAIGDGNDRIRNRSTGDYMHIENLQAWVQMGSINTDWWSARWNIAAENDYVRIRNVWQSSNYIHIENLAGYAQQGTIDMGWDSAKWYLETVGSSTPVPTSTSTPTLTSAATATPASATATPTTASGITTDLTEGGTALAQYDDSPSAERYPNAFDNSSATKYLTFHASGWIQYQFSGTTAYAVNRYTVTSANDAAERDPLSWTLAGSNDGSGFTTVDTRSGQDFASRFQTNSYTISNTTPYRYYRITMNNNSGTILQVAEIQLFGNTGNTATPTNTTASTATPTNTTAATATSTRTPTRTPTPASATATPTTASGITTDLTEGGTASAQYDDSPSAERYPNAFDNSSATKYLTFHASGWVQYLFSGTTAYAVNRYTVTSANDAVERDPLSWTLAGSNDGSGFTTVDTRSAQDFANRFQTNSYSISNTTAYRYYRITMNNNSGTILQVAEIQLFGNTGNTATPTSTTANTATPTNTTAATATPTRTPTPTPPPAGASIPGRIEAEDYNSGGEGVAYHDTTSGNAGGAYRSDDVDIEACGEGGYNVGWIVAGEWLKYDVSVSQAAVYSATIRHASAASAAQNVHLEMDGSDISGSVSLAATGGWQTWQSTTVNNLSLSAGNHVLTISCEGTDFNINYIDFTLQGTSTNTPTAPNTASPTAASNTSTPTRTPSPTPVATVTGTALFLYESGDQVLYGAPASDNYTSHWQVLDSGDGFFRIRNRSSGEYMHIENQQAWVQCGTIYDTWASAKWSIADNGSFVLISNSWIPANHIHIIDRVGYAQQGAVDTSNNSARWVLQSVDGTYVRIMSYNSGPTATPTNTLPPTNTPTPTNTLVPGSRGATMPYKRYEAENGSYGGGATLKASPTFAQLELATQASDQRYVELPSNGSYVQWTVNSGGAGVTMRFTMPDTSDGMGQSGSLDCYVNGSRVTTVALSSYWMWQWFAIGSDQPQDAPNGGVGRFAFDEVHWKLPSAVNPGDIIRIQSTGGLVYGVDFLEIEPVPPAISQPPGSLSVTSYGATANDSTDDLAAFTACVNAAASGGNSVYIPAGTFNLGTMWVIGTVENPISNITITGAGMWHTNIQFTNPASWSGGISVRLTASGSIDFSNMWINSMLRSRYSQQAVYKCFMDNFGTNSKVHDVWEEHFECGFWVGDYAHTPAVAAQNLQITNCRIRNNLADGVNFCQGTSNSLVQNCSIRNNGDDGLAVWPDSTMSAPMAVNNRFNYNTIENNWRAGGIAFFGGSGHSAANNYIKDCFMGSGIRLNTTFPGYHFENNTGITFSNTTIVACGTSTDCYNGERGAIDLEASTTSISNITFDNIEVINTQRDAIQIGYGGGFSGILFRNLTINGTGLDSITTSRFSQPHLGMAIYTYTGNGSATFTNLTTSNIEAPELYMIQSGFIVTFN